MRLALIGSILFVACRGVLMPALSLAASPAQTSDAYAQVVFMEPEGLIISWQGLDIPFIAPVRWDFQRGETYHLIFSNIPDHPGVELHWTMKVANAHFPRSDAYLARRGVVFRLSTEDVENVLQGNYITKVVYLPRSESCDIETAETEILTLVHEFNDPTTAAIAEARRRGIVLAVLRPGNVEPELCEGDKGCRPRLARLTGRFTARFRQPRRSGTPCLTSPRQARECLTY